MRVGKATCLQVAYDHGYPKTLAYSQLPSWFAKLHASILDGENIDPLSPSQCGNPSYVETIEKAHPGYMHFLFRYAQGLLGPLPMFMELCESMNKKSAVPIETRPTLSLS